MSAAVNVFDTLAIEKAVSDVTDRPAATSARPDSPCHVDPSAKTIATDTPGIPYLARRAARRASRTARRSGVALAEPRSRRPPGGHGANVGAAPGRTVAGDDVAGDCDAGAVPVDGPGVPPGRGSALADAARLGIVIAT